jgi:hypothetical protein
MSYDIEELEAPEAGDLWRENRVHGRIVKLVDVDPAPGRYVLVQDVGAQRRERILKSTLMATYDKVAFARKS